ncbi:MAG: CoA pyrophosphatase [Pseudomonadota bacterium]
MTDAALRAQLAARLAVFDRQPLAINDLRHAAVAIVVTSGAAGDPAILLTRRPAKMGRHAGQYALPGGRVDPGETDADAALRELDEELGLSLPQDAILGQLDDYPTRSGFRMAPFVIWAGPAADLTPDPGEVAKVFHIPFTELDSTAIPLFEPGESPDRPVLYSDFPAVGTTMFSPTAAVIYQFREVCLRGQPTRVAHFDQPRFAWR